MPSEITNNALALYNKWTPLKRWMNVSQNTWITTMPGLPTHQLRNHLQQSGHSTSFNPDNRCCWVLMSNSLQFTRPLRPPGGGGRGASFTLVSSTVHYRCYDRILFLSMPNNLTQKIIIQSLQWTVPYYYYYLLGILALVSKPPTYVDTIGYIALLAYGMERMGYRGGCRTIIFGRPSSKYII